MTAAIAPIGPAALAPRGAIPNWAPATTADEYLRNCREGLEEYSDRRFALLMGWPRVQVFRVKLVAELPEALFERLLDAGICSAKALAGVALALRRGRNCGDVERCPHCGGVLRVRYPIGKAARSVIATWLDEGQP
jgi:hypothetical protein